jgi:hypothetical protein
VAKFARPAVGTAENAIVFDDRGADAVQARFPIPLSTPYVRFPAHGLPMIFLTWLRSSWVADRASQAVQAVPVEPLLSPLAGLSSS